MIIDNGSLVLMFDAGAKMKGGRFTMLSWEPTLGFYSVHGSDFHAPPRYDK